jgi:hypothetical protein
MKHKDRPSSFAPRHAIGPRLDFVPRRFPRIYIPEMMEKRVHAGRSIEVPPLVEGRVEGRRRGTLRPPAKQSVVQQGRPGDALALAGVAELAKVELAVEAAFQNRKTRRKNMHHCGPQHPAEHLPEHHPFDEHRANPRDGHCKKFSQLAS